MLRPDFQAINEAPPDNHLHYHALYQMDELMEKLKLLHYERHLLSDMKMKPLTRFYFVRATNAGEQFFMFTSICAWLIRKTGREFEPPQEFHDPSKTIAEIVKVLQELDISTDFPTNKLMQGAGFVCVYVMDALATQACKVNQPQLQRPEIKTEEDVVAEIVANENEIILEKVEEEQMAMQSDDDSDGGGGGIGGSAGHNAILDLKFTRNRGRAAAAAANATTTDATALADSESWR